MAVSLETILLLDALFGLFLSRIWHELVMRGRICIWLLIKSRLQNFLSFMLNLLALGKRSKVLILVTSSNNVIILSRCKDEG